MTERPAKLRSEAVLDLESDHEWNHVSHEMYA